MGRTRTNGLTTQQIERLGALGKLGSSVSPADAGLILSIPAQKVKAYLATPAGKELWSKSRAAGRVELLGAIRQHAFEGNAQAQKLLATLLECDDSRGVTDQRIKAGAFREIIDRSAPAIAKRIRDGDMIPAGSDKAYAIADLLRLFPMLWDRLSKARHQVAHLEKITKQVALDADQAENRSKVARAELDEMNVRERQGKLIEKLIAEREQSALTKCFVGILERAAMELPSLLWGKKKTRRAMSAAVEEWCNARRVELVGDGDG